MDPMISLSDIAKKIGRHPKVVRYHYKEHVLRKGFLSNYVVHWEGPSGRIKDVLTMMIKISMVDQDDLNQIKEILYRFPFTWFISLSRDERTIISFIGMPPEYYSQSVKFLSDKLPFLGNRLQLTLLDSHELISYTIPHNLFDEKLGWIFNPSLLPLIQLTS